jgi:hypothetical protein
MMKHPPSQSPFQGLPGRDLGWIPLAVSQGPGVVSHLFRDLRSSVLPPVAVAPRLVYDWGTDAVKHLLIGGHNPSSSRY